MCRVIGYNFKNPILLLHAVTHASKEAGYNYERLEFLGDAVLEFIVSTVLFEKYGAYDEGKLTALRANIVREQNLAAWASQNKIGGYIVLGKGEENSGGRNKSSILCDVVESIIGAVYLDGGVAAALALVTAIMQYNAAMLLAENDPKTELQIELQKNACNTLSYEVYKSVGPPHDMTFFVNAKLNGAILASGKGKSKKQAEQCAAKKALRSLKEEQKRKTSQ